MALITFSAQTAVFQVTSNGVKTGGQLTTSHVFSGFGCEDGNTSPSLTWSGVPEGTKSFAVAIYDPDAFTGSDQWHWTVVSIPATVTYLPVDAGRCSGTKLPTSAVQGRNDFGYAGFGGACSPKGDKPHHYQFKVQALETEKISIDSNSSGALVGYILNANEIAIAKITPVCEIKQSESMLVRGRTNLKIEEIRVRKHHEIHRVKPLMPALCRIRQGRKVIDWETHTLIVDSN